MFINISNHPSDKWGDGQREAALQLSAERNETAIAVATIHDIAFPNILPAATEAEVAVLAQQYYQQLISMAVPMQTVVHIMGEMTFTHYFVNLASQAGFLCVASTSERNTIENLDGSKTIVFNFVQFRPYPRL